MSEDHRGTGTGADGEQRPQAATEDGGAQRWLQGKSALFTSRRARREADAARRRNGRRILRAKDVALEWEAKNGVFHGGLVSQDNGFDNRIIEVDCHIYPPHSQSVTHHHNEAVIFILRGHGYSTLDDERVEWGPGDTLYIPAGVWHRHTVTSDTPAMVIAAKPLPLQEYLGELRIDYRGDEPEPGSPCAAGSFAEEFAKINWDDAAHQEL